MQGAVPPILNVNIRFLVQFTDCGGRDLAAPESLGDVLHTPDGYAGQIHLNEGLFHTAFPAAIPLNDSSLKRNPFEFGHLEGDISGSGGEVAVIVAAAAPGRSFPHSSLPGPRPERRADVRQRISRAEDRQPISR